MTTVLLIIIAIAVVAVLAVGSGVGLLVRSRRARKPLERPSGGVITPPTAPPGAGQAPPAEPADEPAPGSGATTTTLERPESTASRLVRLRQRLAGSQGGLGRGLLSLLSRERIDEDTWEEIEDTLITADVGVGPTQELVERLRTRLRVEGTSGGPGP